MDDAQRFSAVGGCWCPGDRTLDQLRFMWHTPECASARWGWAAYARLVAAARERRAAARAAVEVEP